MELFLQALILEISITLSLPHRQNRELEISKVLEEFLEKEIIKFFKQNPVRGTERTLEQTLERVRIHSKFLSSLKKEFA